MVYVGVDLHRKRSHVVALDPAGQVMLSRRIGNAPAEFLRIFGELGPQPIEVAFEATYGGHITKQGSRWLRWMLVEAATTAVRDPQLGRFAAQIAQRRGPKIARVALARRLLTLCYYALRDKDGCRAYPAPAR